MPEQPEPSERPQPPEHPRAGDVLAAARALAPLAARADDDERWERPAAPTRWSAARSVSHVADALLLYAGLVATRATGPRPPLREGRPAVPSEQLADVDGAAAVLAAVLGGLGRERAWHPSGLADAAGWCGMAVTEVLVHGTDAAGALQVELPLPTGVCERTVRRVFPWAAHALDVADPATVLLAVTGRRHLDGLGHDPDWWWWSAPLEEWGGAPHRRTRAPHWR
ncbi:maleylpyruvate isomerase N-terminal domain-containing protein [Kineococcus sp. TRM81007]|uniref:maleylpyruvate isomerase N-terminal domain-containing protein n=1 Tax=Kineococcus sp. TRM81007 TaxID=2925831 RepID=UPI001F5984B6|nr:maleylpyruvate isomerase N-terminal domain-containing protein [Kineococcus sp. TRM81007]MCI2238437.1 maleylpyruvate isomerase N-terminal domain-containing protein [Kineococcus sp. TRM81007]